ncbi:cysteine hydrolase [Orrella sp. JC864]|uniref:cysteine hydrolase n=1 Tax=Orrella sp. JC864 TaxID=3120298 RepID=UPI0030082301
MSDSLTAFAPVAGGRHLLVIDAQNDFCDIAGAALPVPGADADMRRLAEFVRRHVDAIDDMTLTLDSHYRIDIAHPGFWRTGEGGAVAPFTPVSAEQVRAGQLLPRQAQALPQVLAYLDALQARGRYRHMVWPVHCELGSWGHGLHAELADACRLWEDRHGRQAVKILKGANPWTEHYSAIEAEVPDPGDPATGTHHALLDRLAASGELLVAGEAGSHCVKATVEHVAAYRPAIPLVLLTDAMSPVQGYAQEQARFLAGMAARGAVLAATGTALGQAGRRPCRA